MRRFVTFLCETLIFRQLQICGLLIRILAPVCQVRRYVIPAYIMNSVEWVVRDYCMGGVWTGSRTILTRTIAIRKLPPGQLPARQSPPSTLPIQTLPSQESGAIPILSRVYSYTMGHYSYSFRVHNLAMLINSHCHKHGSVKVKLKFPTPSSHKYYTYLSLAGKARVHHVVYYYSDLTLLQSLRSLKRIP